MDAPVSYRLIHGVYQPVYHLDDDLVYFDPIGLRVRLEGVVYSPFDIPLEVFYELSWDDQIDILFFEMEASFEQERRARVAEQQRLAALELQERIISLAHSMSRAYQRRARRLEAEKKKSKLE